MSFRIDSAKTGACYQKQYVKAETGMCCYLRKQGLIEYIVNFPGQLSS